MNRYKITLLIIFLIILFSVNQVNAYVNDFPLLGKTIYLEDTSGDVLFIIQISEQGVLTRMDNCEIADIDTNEIRIQQIKEVK